MPSQIMVVDDELSMRELLKNTLELAGFETILASSAKEFSSLLESKHPDCIILDIMLGDADGTETYRDLLQSKKLDPKIPVVFLSALAADQTPVFPNPKRQYALVGKPFDPEVFISKLRETLAEFKN